MVEVLRAHRKEFGFGADAPDFVQESAGGLDAEPDEIHILLHLLDLRFLPDARGADGLVEAANVIEHITAGRDPTCFASLLPANLCEDPRITNGAAADH